MKHRFRINRLTNLSKFLGYLDYREYKCLNDPSQTSMPSQSSFEIEINVDIGTLNEIEKIDPNLSR